MRDLQKILEKKYKTETPLLPKKELRLTTKNCDQIVVVYSPIIFKEIETTREQYALKLLSHYSRQTKPVNPAPFEHSAQGARE
jgi:hypothetical protein